MKEKNQQRKRSSDTIGAKNIDFNRKPHKLILVKLWIGYRLNKRQGGEQMTVANKKSDAFGF